MIEGLLNNIIIFVAPVIGGAFAISISKKVDIKLFIALSGAYLLSISILHLLPEAYHNDHLTTGRYILIGFFIQVVLEQLSSGIEHGHTHLHKHGGRSFVLPIMLGLSFHAFIEGLPLGEHHHGEHNHMPLVLGIALHKIPAAFALVTVFRHENLSRQKIVLLLFLFALITPMTSFVSAQLGFSDWVGHKYMGLLMGLVVGSFLHISTTILFESSTESHQFSVTKILAILAGVLLALIT